ncbi:MAG: glycoside hydrolase family 130 protein [Alicyclobacillus macrosporangiidus]|uniref:glycoside hydrolase family 130 protein n=1 Tax=Alicyclobacillus macrosporangiidus TaxID=392015 RepID=UPI0026F1CC45|nr:glycoside hydrolase family 130 protein [Alicyclobacillus macrosporangiidus]MCL6599231.1 glycoside hydrolase family 130 protein [Alicyclobacillus macrosporangiidus]
MRAIRFPENPLLTPKDVPPSRPDLKVIGAFNAGVARYGDEVILLLRVAEQAAATSETVGVPVYDPATGQTKVQQFDRSDTAYDFSDPRAVRRADTLETVWLTSMSHLRVARSRDGRHFTVDEKPLVQPETPYEAFGVEDPRVARIGDAYYITYTAVSGYGVAVGLAVTRDFQKVERLGLIFPPENKDVVLFPEAVDGRYFALHRPAPRGMGALDIWIADSPDLRHWGNHRYLFGRRPGMWDGQRIGGGAVPIRTNKGWLVLYHGADEDNRYAMGAALLDLDDPGRVIARSKEPILAPETPYEMSGFFGGVVFSCGALLEGDQIRMYYGVADEAIAAAEFSLSEVLDTLCDPAGAPGPA